MENTNDGENLFDFEDASDGTWREHWVGMPEYSSQEIKPYMTILVHFKGEQDYTKFAELIGQNLTERTKYIWFPKFINEMKSRLVYTDEDKT
jgi:hypothetical protein